jgi:hypothetical protein
MKSIAILLLAVSIILLTCGCATQAPASAPATATPASMTTAPAPATVPDFTGRWTGTADGVSRIEGFRQSPHLVYNITVQTKSVVTGTKEYLRSDNKTYYENFYGVISHNGELILGDSTSGYSFATLVGPDSMEVQNVEAGPDAKAYVMVLTRQK